MTPVKHTTKSCFVLTSCKSMLTRFTLACSYLTWQNWQQRLLLNSSISELHLNVACSDLLTIRNLFNILFSNHLALTFNSPFFDNVFVKQSASCCSALTHRMSRFSPNDCRIMAASKLNRKQTTRFAHRECNHRAICTL